MTRILRALVGLALAIGGVAVLTPRTFPATTPTPGATDPPAEVATFGLQVVATGLCAYVALVLLALLLVEVRLLPIALRRAVDRWTAGGLAGGIRQVVGASVLAVGLLPFAPTAAHAQGAPPPVMTPVDEPPSTTTSPPLPTSPPVMAPIDEPPSTTTTPPRIVPVDRPPTSPPAIDPSRSPTPAHPTPTSPPRIEVPPSRAQHPSRLGRPHVPTTAETVVVQPGDSFWSITDDLLQIRLARPPTDKEVIGPWLELIAANIDVLADPDDPDLLRPGAVLHLPAGPPGPR